MHVYGIVKTNIKSYHFKANILGGGSWLKWIYPVVIKGSIKCSHKLIRNERFVGLWLKVLSHVRRTPPPLTKAHDQTYVYNS